LWQKTFFGAKRQENSFYTTSQKDILPPKAPKIFFIALRAEFYFERHVIFTISLREIVKMTCRSEEYSAAAGGKNLLHNPENSFYTTSQKDILPPKALKIFFMALRAKLYFERQLIFTISRSEIVKMSCLSRENSAA
jgi:hypothetical protein